MDKTKVRNDFGGPSAVKMITIFMIVVPISVYVLSLEANFNNNVIEKYSNVSTYFNISSYLFNVGLYILMASFSLIPFGGKKMLGPKTVNGQFEYYLNGPFLLFILFTTIFTLHEFGWNVLKFITNNYLQLLVSAIILATLLALFVYYRSFTVPRKYINTQAEDNVNFYDFFIGREVNPRLFGTLDLYTLIIKIGVTITVSKL